VLIDGHAHRNVVGGTRRSVIPQDTFSGNKGYGLAIIGRAHDNRVFGLSSAQRFSAPGRSATGRAASCSGRRLPQSPRRRPVQAV